MTGCESNFTAVWFGIGVTSLPSFQRLSITVVWFLALSLDSWYVSHQSSFPTPLYPLFEKLHFHSSPHSTPLLSSSSPTAPPSHPTPQPQPKPGFSASVISFRTYRVCKRALETWAASLQKMCLGFLILSITSSSEKALYSSPYPSCQPLTRSRAGDGNGFKKTAVCGLYF